MKTQTDRIRIVYIIGVVAFILGTLDPMEGSIVIAAACGLLALATSLRKDKHRKIFLSTFIMIAVGVFFLFYFSSLGGFPPVSWWWSILILPYPVGWLITVITLIVRAVKKERLPAGV